MPSYHTERHKKEEALQGGPDLSSHLETPGWDNNKNPAIWQLRAQSLLACCQYFYMEGHWSWNSFTTQLFTEQHSSHTASFTPAPLRWPTGTSTTDNGGPTEGACYHPNECPLHSALFVLWWDAHPACTWPLHQSTQREGVTTSITHTFPGGAVSPTAPGVWQPGNWASILPIQQKA